MHRVFDSCDSFTRNTRCTITSLVWYIHPLSAVTLWKSLSSLWFLYGAFLFQKWIWMFFKSITLVQTNSPLSSSGLFWNMCRISLWSFYICILFSMFFLVIRSIWANLFWNFLFLISLNFLFLIDVLMSGDCETTPTTPPLNGNQ